MLSPRIFSLARPQLLVAGLMADKARTRVSGERGPALILEAQRVWIYALTAG